MSKNNLVHLKNASNNDLAELLKDNIVVFCACNHTPNLYQKGVENMRRIIERNG